jgi:demethylmenaquinone methyltransferase/2-methoxy-6-polyprenyl-1,4-benzoquinol methylase
MKQSNDPNHVSANPAFSFASRDEKKSYVRRMFGEIAGRYDFFNHFLSFGFDRSWRRKAISLLHESLIEKTHPHILDVACGTGDLAFEATEQIPGAQVTGLDITRPMLDLFQTKIDERKANICVLEGDVEALPFADGMFDAVTIGFGTRNFTNLSIAFEEITRVLRPGGVLINLELAKPRMFPMKQMYALYFNVILPITASLMSRHDSAYRYLPDSLRRFPDLEPLADLLKESGFSSAEWKTLTGGIVAVHIARK